MKLPFHNSDQQVSCDSKPDLRFNRVFIDADKTLDAQMLLDPFTEQLNLSAPFPLYSAAMVNADSAELYVRNTKQ